MKFDDNFKEFIPLIRSISSMKSRSTGIPKEDFESELCEALWVATQTYDETKGCSITTWVSKLLKQAAIRVIKSKHGTYYRRVWAVIDDLGSEDEDDPKKPRELSDGSTAEDEFFRRRNKKKIDQRQLIDFLVQSGPSDPSTIALVEAFLLAPSDATDTSIAKSIGIHHETAKRKLRKLSRRYDANRFGDVRDYLAV